MLLMYGTSFIKICKAPSTVQLRYDVEKLLRSDNQEKK